MSAEKIESIPTVDHKPHAAFFRQSGWLMIAAVLGGFNSLPGAVVGGVLLGVLEALGGTYVSSASKDMISYSILIAVILARPQGIIGVLVPRKV